MVNIAKRKLYRSKKSLFYFQVDLSKLYLEVHKTYSLIKSLKVVLSWVIRWSMMALQLKELKHDLGS